MEYLPYTYLIGWVTLNKWYYGVEYGIKKTPCANPKNLWISYFTSSNLVTHFRMLHGEPDIVQVRKVFSKGSLEERMEESINWEKRVLSKINIIKDLWLNGRIGGNVGPVSHKKLSLVRYGVENVFQSPEIKEKIKSKMLTKYGVEHPSHSEDLLEKKKQNNIKKYGVGCNLELPYIREKAANTCRTESVKTKRQQTILDRYGVSHISQNKEVKKCILKIREELSNRDTVKLIREYKRVFKITLHGGWYQSPEDQLNNMLSNIQSHHGIFTLEELIKTEVSRKYSSSIKVLQDRDIVRDIKKYKEKYGRNLKLGKCWDRKSEEYLKEMFQELIKKYGNISE